MLRKQMIHTSKRDEMIEVTNEIQAFVDEHGIQEGVIFHMGNRLYDFFNHHNFDHSSFIKNKTQPWDIYPCCVFI